MQNPTDPARSTRKRNRTSERLRRENGALRRQLLLLETRLVAFHAASGGAVGCER